MAFVAEGHEGPRLFQAPRVWVVQDMVDGECPELVFLRFSTEKVLVLKIPLYALLQSRQQPYDRQRGDNRLYPYPMRIHGLLHPTMRRDLDPCYPV